VSQTSRGTRSLRLTLRAQPRSPEYTLNTACCRARVMVFSTPPAMMFLSRHRTLVFICGLLLASLLAAQDNAARLIRTTEALAPEEELRKLRAPDGFTVQLFAADPMINKPINLAFDARGRLWVSSTTEYPYAAPTNRWADAHGSRVRDSRDAIKILEDTDGDGRADKVTDFADSLNIPTGVLPWHKPEHKAGCIAWSIPNLWYFADTDGDGRCDLRQVLFGPLGYERDTHGMCSSFRLGLDGWVYATHGFNNTSHFKVRPANLRGAKPGDPGTELTLNSGNVFRFRPDGSRIEIWSWGQVNPFGLAFDAHGNLYSADCHSAPIYQLLRGAHYPSFGKPHDGLGFGPTMLSHSHGSTGICGVEFIDGNVWGAQWNDHILVGNPVTSRVNHDRIEWRGSTPVAIEQPDFITSDDPWFRPVDLRLGPDGVLYVADFYNRIIGHYEVPLDHPGRDRERGRIWRISPPAQRGTRNAELKLKSPVLPRDDDVLIPELMSPNATRRSLAVRELVIHPEAGRFGTLTAAASGHWHFRAQNERARLISGALWVLHQQDKLDDATLLDALKDRDPTVRTHARRVLAERGVTAALRTAAIATLQEEDAHVRRAAAAALQQHPSLDCLPPLLSLYPNVPAGDTHLRHAVLLALREHLMLPGAFMTVLNWQRSTKPTGEWQGNFYSIARVVPTAEAAAFVFGVTRDARPLNNTDLLQSLTHVGRHGDSNLVTEALEFARNQFKADVCASVEAAQALHNGLAERGETRSEPLLAWAQELARRLLAQTHAASPSDWLAEPADNANTWTLQQRKCADGREAMVLSSLNTDLPGAEQRTGTLRSKPFAAPAKLSLWLCGHRGFPGTEAHEKNFVRLVDAATGAELQRAYPPRDDVCRRVEWGLSAHTGKRVRLEIVDGDSGRAYAWLGITRIEPPMVNVERFGGDEKLRKALRSLAVILRFTAPVDLRDQLGSFLPANNAPKPPPVSLEERAKLDALIRARAIEFAKARRDPVRGAAVFAEHCAGCHRLNGNGGLIGPQLDGIGARGGERLCEDILDPNRNVDSHFLLHTFKLRDGSTLGGFVRGEAGAVLLIADPNGQEQRVAKADVAEDTVTPLSLMPAVFDQTIPEADLHDLLAYLLQSAASLPR
jgi:putative heme-binding domain-containing protein